MAPSPSIIAAGVVIAVVEEIAPSSSSSSSPTSSTSPSSSSSSDNDYDDGSSSSSSAPRAPSSFPPSSREMTTAATSSSSSAGVRRRGVAIDVVVVAGEGSSSSDRPTADSSPAAAYAAADATRDRPFLSRKGKIKLMYFLFRFSTGIPNPFMTLYMQHVGLGPDMIGTLQAIRPIVTMLSAPVWGGLADGTGRKKLVLISTFTLSSMCRVSARLLSGNIVHFALSLCVTSAFYAPVSSLLDSIVVSSLGEHDKVNFGRLRLWGELGSGVASSIMINVINRKDGRGFDYMFLLHALSSVVALISMLYCVPATSRMKDRDVDRPIEPRAPSSTPVRKTQHYAADWKEGLRVIFGDVQILSVFGLVATAGYSLAILENFCYINIRQMYAESGMMEIAGRDIGLYRVFHSLGGTLAWWYSGALGGIFGTDAVMFASVCCLPLCFYLYAGVGAELDSSTKLGFLTAEAIRSGIFAALWSTATVRVNRSSPPHVSSMVQTMMEVAYRGIGHTSGSYLGGMLCKTLDIPTAFLVVGKGLVSFLCMVGVIGFWSHKKIIT